MLSVEYHLDIVHHHPFIPGVLTNLFILLEPMLFSQQSGVSRFLQPSLHKEQSCASISFNLPNSIPFSTTSFHVYFGQPYFEPSTTIFFLSLKLFHHPFFLYAHAETIAISALSQELLYLHDCHISNCLITDAIT